ncbi:MAG TPA: SUMF1/EgtB/PvdO family nonheme iron enzyme [Pirellulales bacterium]|jgi:formylglycine-generating enzyme required for sulfatase activity|nr:SUMF1/EgtB/PvdO family nonheme iron enzyme [Pirellulales bacterium]
MSHDPKSLPPTAAGSDPAFDPYYQWLGIPPREQPANYYRLLGLSLFEENAEVIAFAAERQMSHVRMFQAGPHSPTSQKILNELAAAELCLTRPDRKTAYDEELQQKLRSQASQAITINMRTPPSVAQAAAAVASSQAGPAASPVRTTPLAATPVAAASRAAASLVAASLVAAPLAAAPLAAAPLPDSGSFPAFDASSPPPVMGAAWHASPWVKIGLIAICVASTSVLAWVGLQWLNHPKRARPKPDVNVAQSPAAPPDSSPAGDKEPVEPPPFPVPPPDVPPVVANVSDSGASQTGSNADHGLDHAATENEKPKPAESKEPAPGSVAPAGEPATVPKIASAETTRVVPESSSEPHAKPSPDAGTPPTVPPQGARPETTASAEPAKAAAPDATAEAPARLPAPTSLAQRRARELLDQVWAGQVAAAASTSAKTVLAEQLLEKMDQLQASPTERFVMLDQAEELAVAAGNLRLALNIVNQQAREFEIDATASRANLLQAILPKLPTELNREFVAAALDASDEAYDAHNYPLADKIADWGLATARKINNAELIKTLSGRKDLIQEALQKLERIAAAKKVLAERPNDTAAQQAVGEYLCLEENDWDNGLPYLAKAGNAELAELARADLSRPAAPEDQLELADRWWNCAFGVTADAASPYRVRALFWYRTALPQFTGLKKARIAQRIQELQRLGTATEPPLAAGTFDRTAAHEFQRRWAKAVKSTPSRSNSLNMTLALIPAGSYQMGAVPQDGAAAGDEKPAHAVQITRPFYLSSDEVTVDQFSAFVKATGYETDRELEHGRSIFPQREQHLEVVVREAERAQERKMREQFKSRSAKFLSTWKMPGYLQSGNSPVVYLSWNDAVAFCNWLSKRERAKYRLPTEAEWEFACRSGTDTIFFNGDQSDELIRIGNIADAFARKAFPNWTGAAKGSDGYQFSAPVGHYALNAFNVHDMHGNVAEWCADWYGADYYANSPSENPGGPKTGGERVYRGGGWCDYPVDCRSSARGHAPPNNHAIYLGFRVVCEP